VQRLAQRVLLAHVNHAQNITGGSSSVHYLWTIEQQVWTQGY
jgi:hypothetical protein